MSIRGHDSKMRPQIFGSEDGGGESPTLHYDAMFEKTTHSTSTFGDTEEMGNRVEFLSGNEALCGIGFKFR